MRPSDRFFVPCYPLFEKVQLALIPIQKQLLLVQSMLKWVACITHQNPEHSPFGWMLHAKEFPSKERQLEALLTLKDHAHELGSLLKQIYLQLSQFASFNRVRIAYLALYETFQKLPIIEADLQLLSLEGDLIDNKEIVPNLLAYVEQLFEVQQKAFQLKEVLLKEVLDNLSLSLEQVDKTL